MKDRLHWILFLLLGTLIFASSAGCERKEEIPIPQAKEGVYVYDDDGILDSSVKEQLNIMLKDLEKKTEVEFAVVTVKSLLGKEIARYGITVANGLGVGKKDKHNGVLLLMSKSDKKVTLQVGKGMEGLLNDAKCGRILDEFFVPHREKDDYDSATKLTVQATINIIAADANVEIDGVDGNIIVSSTSIVPVILILVVVIIIIIILVVLDIVFNDGDIVCVIISSGGGGGSSGGGGFGGGGFGGGGACR